MQCKMLVVTSELEERSDMRESREIEVVIWVYTREMFNEGGYVWRRSVSAHEEPHDLP